MVTNVVMPKFGLSMEEGTINSWLVNEGDKVKKGDEIAEVSSEKITNMVEAPEDGVIRKIIGEADSTLPCGELIAIIADENEDISNAASENKKAEPAANAVSDAISKVEPVSKDLSSVNITPRAKKIAEEKGIDYSSIAGTGIGGAITIDDIKKYVKEGKNEVKAEVNEEVKQEVKPEVKQVVVPEVQSSAKVESHTAVNGKKMSQMQRIIAKKMFESMSTTAQTTISRDVDVTELVNWYKASKAKYKNEGFKLSYTAILIKVIASVLEKHPQLRTRIVGENELQTINDMNIGVAIDIEEGLVVPVIKSANAKDLKTICFELVDLTQRAKQNKLSMDEMSGGTLTLTNLGMFDIKYFTPVLNMPESAILGIGAITEQPMIKDGGLFSRSIMNFSLTHDHRVIDGAPAARFLKDINAILTDEKEFVKNLW
jgi:pyruvate dehydrogenase E2 component (dihydrolipoamide acetyltransferase)